MAAQDYVIIELDKVYKIFGPQPRGRALQLAKSGMRKNDVQAQTEHVVGMTNVSFQVNRGETFVIMGLSGSGKSTAIRTVNKLHDITDGHVWVDGVDVQALSGPPLQQFRREKMGMVFQHFALFPHRSVIDNTGYGLKVQGVDKTARDEASMRALNLVGLGSFAKSMPRELSGGMQQRVGLARALAADPDVLLMDEALSVGDKQFRARSIERVNELRESAGTVIMASHSMASITKAADQVLWLQDGKVRALGDPEEVTTAYAEETEAKRNTIKRVKRGKVSGLDG